MKKIILFVMITLLSISLAGCIPSDPLVIETERLVEVEKEVVVIQTETEVVTVETNIVIPSGTVYFTFTKPKEAKVHYVFGSEVYVVAINEVDPLLEDPYFELVNIDYYKNGGFVQGYTVPDSMADDLVEDALGRTLEEYVVEFMTNSTFRAVEDTYEDFENYYLLNQGG